MSNIDFTKPVETVTGIPVQIISIYGREPYPVVGYVGEHSLALDEWTSSGLYNVEELDYSDYNLRNKVTQPQEPWAAEKAAFAAGETIQYRSDYRPTWVDVKDPFWVRPTPSNGNPQYRIKPKPQKVPLEPCDVPPGSVLRCLESSWNAILSITRDIVRLDGTGNISLETLSKNEAWQIKRPTDTEWQPCYKETQP